MKGLAVMASAREYDAAFETARVLEYVEVEGFELRKGFAIDRARLEEAARVLACPVKKNAPHWQHGRIIYASVRKYLSGFWDVDRQRFSDGHPLTLLDIGTAKGFSALCLKWALDDSSVLGQVFSVDVIDPTSRETRNTVAELHGLKTLSEILAPWPESQAITFLESTGIDFLKTYPARIHVAFVDGKHEGHVVRQEGKLLAQRQKPGDLALFDDCQIPAISVAVVSLEEWYRIEYVTAGPRDYAIGVRR